MKNLISMVDYVLKDESMSSSNIINYAKFLKQPLKLWMFVPCDEDGNVLEDPTHNGKSIETMRELLKEYQQAKERCLFDGFFNTTESPQYKMYIQNGMQSVFYIARNSTTVKNIWGMRTIEDLIKDTPIQLTQTAIKQIGL